MENKDLILVKGENEVYLEKRRRGVSFKRTALRLFALVLLACALLCAIFLLPRVKNFIDGGALGGIFSPNKGTDVGENPSTNQGGNQNTQSPPENSQVGENETPSVPSGAYQIKDTSLEYKVTNETKLTLEDTAPTLISPQEIRSRYGNEAPLVLITHRAPKECYSNGKYYTRDSDFYSENENIAALAWELSSKLNALGIKTLYLDEEYAKGSVFGTTDEYEKSLSETLARYPSISYVFCLSRGIYINDDMSIYRESAVIDGEKCAQVRVISGTSGEEMTEQQAKNVSFALDFAKLSGEKAGTLVCESKIARFPLGQNISPFALEFELGTYGNTFGEAQKSTAHLAILIFEYLSSAVGA